MESTPEKLQNGKYKNHNLSYLKKWKVIFELYTQLAGPFRPSDKTALQRGLKAELKATALNTIRKTDLVIVFKEQGLQWGSLQIIPKRRSQRLAA